MTAAGAVTRSCFLKEGGSNRTMAMMGFREECGGLGHLRKRGSDGDRSARGTRTRSADAAAAGCADCGPVSEGDVEIGAGDRMNCAVHGCAPPAAVTSPIGGHRAAPVAIACPWRH